MEDPPRQNRFRILIFWCLLAFLWMGAVAGLCQLSGKAWLLPASLAMGVGVAVVRAPRWRVRFSWVGGCWGALLLWLLLLRPSLERDWWPEMAVLPRVEQEGSIVRIQGARNFEWSGPSEFVPRWETIAYDLDALNALELIIAPFGDSEMAAHVMLGFGFEDGKRLVISPEARKEVGEDYGLLSGSLKQFELLYIFATESDILKLRAIHRNETLYAYPIKAEPGFIRNLFMDFCDSANQLRQEPRFYSTFRQNCAISLLTHIDRQKSEKIGFRYEVLFPAKSGRLLQRLGYLDSDLPYEKAKERFRIDQRVRRFADEPQFSLKIREEGSP